MGKEHFDSPETDSDSSRKLSTSENIKLLAGMAVLGIVKNSLTRHEDVVIIDVTHLELPQLLDARADFSLIAGSEQYEPQATFGVSSDEFDLVRQAIIAHSEQL